MPMSSATWSFSAPGNGGTQSFEGHYWAAQAKAVCSSGNVSATVVIEASNIPGDMGAWQTLATLTVSSGSSPQYQVATGGPIGWAGVRARCTSLTGTGASVLVVFGAK